MMKIKRIEKIRSEEIKPSLSDGDGTTSKQYYLSNSEKEFYKTLIKQIISKTNTSNDFKQTQINSNGNMVSSQSRHQNFELNPKMKGSTPLNNAYHEQNGKSKTIGSGFKLNMSMLQKLKPISNNSKTKKSHIPQVNISGQSSTCTQLLKEDECLANIINKVNTRNDFEGSSAELMRGKYEMPVRSNSERKPYGISYQNSVDLDCSILGLNNNYLNSNYETTGLPSQSNSNNNNSNGNKTRSFSLDMRYGNSNSFTKMKCLSQLVKDESNQQVSSSSLEDKAANNDQDFQRFLTNSSSLNLKSTTTMQKSHKTKKNASKSSSFSVKLPKISNKNSLSSIDDEFGGKRAVSDVANDISNSSSSLLSVKRMPPTNKYRLLDYTPLGNNERTTDSSSFSFYDPQGSFSNTRMQEDKLVLPKIKNKQVPLTIDDLNKKRASPSTSEGIRQFKLVTKSTWDLDFNHYSRHQVHHHHHHHNSINYGDLKNSQLRPPTDEENLEIEKSRRPKKPIGDNQPAKIEEEDNSRVEKINSLRNDLLTYERNLKSGKKSNIPTSKISTVNDKMYLDIFIPCS